MPPLELAYEGVSGPLRTALTLALGLIRVKAKHHLVVGRAHAVLAAVEVGVPLYARVRDLLQNVSRLNLLAAEAGLPRDVEIFQSRTSFQVGNALLQTWPVYKVSPEVLIVSVRSLLQG